MSSKPQAIVASYDVILSDLDGVAYRGAAAARGAVAGYQQIKDRGVRVVYMTNNSARIPAQTAQQLTSLGIPTEPEDIVSSAITGVMLLKTLVPAGSKVLPLGAEGVFAALEEGGFEIVRSADDEPVAVLHGLNPQETWEKLSEAALAIARGAQYVATNIDATLPRERGEYLGNGSLVAAVSHATGVVPPSSGKPEPAMYQLACERAGGLRPLVVGDRLNTDIVGANRTQYDSAHVLTGVTTMRQVMLALPIERPTYPVFDLRDLATPYYQPVATESGFQVADVEVTVDSVAQRVVVHGRTLDNDENNELGLHEYQALVAAVWAAVDADHDMTWLGHFSPAWSPEK